MMIDYPGYAIIIMIIHKIKKNTTPKHQHA